MLLVDFLLNKFEVVFLEFFLIINGVAYCW